eukprot:1160724-Pelagomonas_calceolata.AAC.10
MHTLVAYLCKSGFAKKGAWAKLVRPSSPALQNKAQELHDGDCSISSQQATSCIAQKAVTKQHRLELHQGDGQVKDCRPKPYNDKEGGWAVCF